MATKDTYRPKESNAALTKPLTPSKELAAIVSKAPLPARGFKKAWDHNWAHSLPDPADKRTIVAELGQGDDVRDEQAALLAFGSLTLVGVASQGAVIV